MNVKFIVSVVVLFILTMVLGLVIHGTLLHDAYQATGLFRTEEESMNYFTWMILGHVSMAVGLTWVYRMGHEPGKPWLMQGIRFGVALFFLMTLSIYLIYYAVMKMPVELVHKQIVYDGIAVIIVGITAALINR